MNYSLIEENFEIKNIVIFDGGFKPNDSSITFKLLNKFIDGLKSSNTCDIKYHKIKDYKINFCDGCKLCWTHLNGKCHHNDDMQKLIEDYETADLIIFSSPASIGDISAILKNFLDRTIATVEPKMVTNDTEHLRNRKRSRREKNQYFMSFSTAGLNEITSNLESMTATYKAIERHNEKMYFIGEVYMGNSFAFNNKFNLPRKNRILNGCYRLGKELIEFKKLNFDIINYISKEISNEEFLNDINGYWEQYKGFK